MKITQSTHLKLSPGNTVTREDMYKFLQTVPDGVPLTIEARTNERDRPWESSTTTIKMYAEWTV